MVKMLDEYLYQCKIWTNNLYNFNDNSTQTNCTLKVFVGYQVIDMLFN